MFEKYKQPVQTEAESKCPYFIEDDSIRIDERIQEFQEVERQVTKRINLDEL